MSQQQPLFKLVGVPLTLPTIVGYNNLSDEQKEDLCWGEDDFADPKAQPFWNFEGSLCFEEQDLQPVRQYFHLLSNTEWDYFLPPCYAVKFNRDNRGMPIEVVIQEVEALTLVLPEVLTQEQAGQLVEKLACHVYSTHWPDPQFNPEPETVSTVVRDLVRYSDIQDHEFDSFREESYSEILTTLFEECRATRGDLREVLSKFFDLELGRTL